MSEAQDMKLFNSAGFQYGYLLGLRKMIFTIGLMVATKPELREELLPALQGLHDSLGAEAVPETVLFGVESLQRAVVSALAPDPP